MTKWRKMNSAPRDGTPILVGMWIKDGERAPCPEPKWEQRVLSFNSEDETLLTGFDAWTVIPKPPHWGKE